MRPVTMERVEQTREKILSIVCSSVLTHEQKVTELERAAESLIEVIDRPDGLDGLMESGAICDLWESNAPPRPRYIVPDYERLFERGSEFLRLAPPRDLDEALNALQIFYRHVPSVTNFPVFIGHLDRLLEPFVLAEGEVSARKKLALFLRYVDRTVTDAFCHADIGPEDSLTGRLILACRREEPEAVPNLTLLYDPEVTPDDFAREAAVTAMTAAGPSFANHPMFSAEFPGKYSIVSCYNGLPTGGGAYTLCRLRLGHLAAEAAGTDDFWQKLDRAINIMAAYMQARINFMVGRSNFFQSNFLAREGFISEKLFTGMFGLVGLAECVNRVMELSGRTGRFGSSAEADELGVEIMEHISAFVNGHDAPSCMGRKFMLHGQVGIDSDTGESPAARIPIGEEPESFSAHLRHCALFHKYFPSGVGDIFPLEPTARQNPDFVLDLVRGAFQTGARFLTLHAADSDVIRVTGYLVKRSEMEKLAGGSNVLQNTTALGLGSAQNAKILERKVR